MEEVLHHLQHQCYRRLKVEDFSELVHLSQVKEVYLAQDQRSQVEEVYLEQEDHHHLQQVEVCLEVEHHQHNLLQDYLEMPHQAEVFLVLSKVHLNKLKVEDSLTH